MTRGLRPPKDDRLVVGFDLSDDAGVVRLPDGTGLVQTIDFFTPIVDDPRTFGALAAVNALSDVYAMGGTPLCCLNVVAFPSRTLPEWVLSEILAGGAEVVAEAGAMLVGGHSVRDKEIKYGLAVSGTVDLSRLWTNAGAQPGDQLVLTKPLGTGVLSTARKRDRIGEDGMAEAVTQMRRLNRDAADAGRAGDVHACTDVTGFGLGGHAWEMARASKVALHLWWSRIPRLGQVDDLAAAGVVPGGTTSNRRFVESALTTGDGVPEYALDVVLDPQTSGGLLLAVPPAELEPLMGRLTDRDVPAAHVGEVQRGAAAVVLHADRA